MSGPKPIALSTMLSAGDSPVPAPMALTLWLGDKFNKLYLNNVDTPDVKTVNLSLDLVPERRLVTVDNAWVPNTEVQPGEEIAVKVSLRPWRGEAVQREVKIRI